MNKENRNLEQNVLTNLQDCNVTAISSNVIMSAASCKGSHYCIYQALIVYFKNEANLTS